MEPPNNHNTHGEVDQDLLHRLTHELRRPATIIRGFLELFQREIPGPLNDDQKEYILLMLKLATSMTGTLNQCIILQELDGQQRTPEPVTFDLVELLDIIIPIGKRNYPHRQHTIRIIKNKPQVTVVADRDHVHIALLQILENAIKYTPNNQEITIAIMDNIEGATIYIADNGIGIPSEYHHLLFKEHLSVRRDHYDEPFGMGLGLYIANKLLMINNARISFEENTPQGSIFAIRFRKSQNGN